MSFRNVYIGRQPILDLNQQIVAYELLFRSDAETVSAASDGAFATANVIVTAFSELGLEHILGANSGYINVDREFLMNDAIELLPRSHVVLELTAGVIGDEGVLARCRTLKASGFRIAIDAVTELNARVQELLPLADVVKVETSQLDAAALCALAGELRRLPCRKLAQKVETQAQAEICRSLGFDLFQGYFFAHPHVLSTKRSNPAKVHLLRLLTLVYEDAAAADIEQELKRLPELTYSLLRMVNSVASGLTRRIDSLPQAIAILGRKPLGRWVQLLIYTAEAGGETRGSALMELAATRGRMLELLATKTSGGNREVADRGFMVGILSLLDVLLETPMSAIVADLGLADEASRALLAREGPLGGLLKLLELKESDDVEGVIAQLAQLPPLELSDLISSELHASTWARSVQQPAAVMA